MSRWGFFRLYSPRIGEGMPDMLPIDYLGALAGYWEMGGIYCMG